MQAFSLYMPLKSSEYKNITQQRGHKADTQKKCQLEGDRVMAPQELHT